MPVFSADVAIAATAYVRADTPEEAQRLFQAHFSGGCEVSLDTHDENVSGLPFDNKNLPQVSLSPAATLWPAGNVETEGHAPEFDEAG